MIQLPGAQLCSRTHVWLPTAEAGGEYGAPHAPSPGLSYLGFLPWGQVRQGGGT